MQSFTDECLFDALLILMEQKDFKTITVSELSKKAGISRSTFYRNYNSIEDILIERFVDMNFGFTFPDNIEEFDLEKHMRQYFGFMIQNKYTLELIIKAKLENKIFELIEYYCKGPFRQYLYKIGFRQKYEISAFIGIFYMMTIDWIKDGAPDPDEAFRITYNLLMPISSRNTQKYM